MTVTVEPETLPDGAPTSGRPRRSRRRRLLIGLAVVALVVVAGAAAVIAFAWGGRPAAPPSPEETLERFRAEGGGVAAARDVPDEAAGLAGLPAEGVYLYEGDGTERLSMLNASQRQGPDLPATVTHTGDGCWTKVLEFNSNHSYEWQYCQRDGVLVETGSVNVQRFDFGVTDVESTDTTICEPAAVAFDPAAAPGTSWDQSCATDDGATEIVGTTTFVGIEPLDIDGDEIAAHRYRQELTYSGEQRGTTVLEFWYEPATALQLRSEAEIRLDSPSPVGAVTYEEQGHYQLTSLTPRT